VNNIGEIWQKLLDVDFRISTDTRGDVSGTIFFALKGGRFDGNEFTLMALENGAIGVVTDNPRLGNRRGVYVVENTLVALHDIARKYRSTFDIPIIAIGGSNGKTTSKELIREVLETRYQVHSTSGNFNNYVGLPLSILSMDKKTDIAIFEIGANHQHEHTELLNILNPTHVIVTNNGLDHLEGFGSREGVRSANREIYDWADSNKKIAFVNFNHPDLIEDSLHLNTITYPDFTLEVIETMPLSIKLGEHKYKTRLYGAYNLENLHTAISVGKFFRIDENTTMLAITKYQPDSWRSQSMNIDGINFIVDCYNANPSSMTLSLRSFLDSAIHPRGIIIGDMLELGEYTLKEHQKIVELVSREKIESHIFIGANFRDALAESDFSHRWFPDSDKAREWLCKQNLQGFTFLLKGSRGMKMEKIIN
jgi:UDP-N-acetylmuramoyl-tripeptide--D-alanyl-D-alanine ligase